MNAVTKNILLNEEVIALNQDELGLQCIPKIKNEAWDVYVKPLKNGDTAVAIVNRSKTAQTYSLNFAEVGLNAEYQIKDLWQHKIIGKGKKWSGNVLSH